jgi:dihydroorotate dehydrogenase (NAD+) catalytic subunit
VARLMLTNAPFEFATPIVLASGPSGFGVELRDVLEYSAVGALTTKTITPRPLVGNPQPRLVDCPCALLNSIGLENPGFERFLEASLPEVLEIPTRHIVSLTADDPEGAAKMAEVLSHVSGIDGIELNLSCPNVDDVVIGANPAAVRSYVRAVRSETTSPLFLKLPGDTGSLIASAEAGLEAGADGLTLINSIRGLRIDHRVGLPMLHRKTGGLSGPAILPIALARVYEARRAFPDAFIIGTGGVTDVESLVEMLAAGADVAGIGFGIMANPGLPTDLRNGLEAWLIERRFESIEDVIGAAHRGGFRVH